MSIAKGSRQEGTPDLGRFLAELAGRKHDIPRKSLKQRMQDANGGYVWRRIWNDQFGPKSKEG